MGYNPVAKNNKNRGGPFKQKDAEGRKHVNKKIKKILDELDEEWIKDEINELGLRLHPDNAESVEDKD